MMTRNYSKLEIATQQLDTALRLFFWKKEYFSAITLAGAAEEILGVYLKRHNQPNAFDQDLESSLRVYQWLFKSVGSRNTIRNLINRTKNSAKHMMGTSDVALRCNAKAEAKEVLDRAVSNYYSLMCFEKLQETQRIKKFNAHLVKKNKSV